MQIGLKHAAYMHVYMHVQYGKYVCMHVETPKIKNQSPYLLGGGGAHVSIPNYPVLPSTHHLVPFVFFLKRILQGRGLPGGTEVDQGAARHDVEAEEAEKGNLAGAKGAVTETCRGA